MFAFMEAPLKIYALLTSVSYTQLLTSCVGNGLLTYVKISDSHSSNPSPLKYSYSSQLANCLNPTTVKPRFTKASDHEQFGLRTNFPNSKRLG